MKKLAFAALIVLLFSNFISCTTDYYYPVEEQEMTDLPADSAEDPADDPMDDPATDQNDPDNSDPASDADPDAGYITYYGDVEPILKQLCVACHNTTIHEDGVDLSTYDKAKYSFNDIIESMQEDDDDIMPPSGPVDYSIIATILDWKVDGFREGQVSAPDTGNTDGTYTYTADIKPLIDQECIVCHGATGAAAGFDISSYDKTVSQIDAIIARIDLQTGQAGVMPTAGRMAENKIQAFIDWYTQGMPE